MKDLPSPINESGTGWSQLGQNAYPVRSELVQSSGRIYCMTRTDLRSEDSWRIGAVR